MGTLLGLSIVAPPGPVMAIMATASAQGRRRESILTALGALSADATWFLLVAVGFVAVLKEYPKVVGALGVAGGVMLLAMAWSAFRAIRRGIGGSTLRGSYRLGFVTAIASPYSFAWWMASGPLVIATLGWPGVAGLFLSIAVYAVAFTYALAWLGARVEHAALVVASVGAVMLAFFGLFFAREGARLLFAGPS